MVYLVVTAYTGLSNKMKIYEYNVYYTRYIKNPLHGGHVFCFRVSRVCICIGDLHIRILRGNFRPLMRRRIIILSGIYPNIQPMSQQHLP